MARQQTSLGRERERVQQEQAQAIMDTVDAQVAWEHVDSGKVFTLYRTPIGSEYLVVRTIGSDRPWIELYEPVDNQANTWDSLRKVVVDREEMLRRLKVDQ